MQGVAVVHEDAGDSEAVHRCHELVADLAALAYPADDQFTAVALALRDRVDGIHEAFLGDRVGLVELLDVCQPVSFCGDDVQRGSESCRIAFGVEDLVCIRRRHGERWDGLADMRERGREEGRDGRERLFLRHEENRWTCIAVHVCFLVRVW